MKSSIRVDFKGLDGIGQQAFEPVIRVILEDSDDVRDGLLKSFFQALGGQSSWLRVKFEGRLVGPDDKETHITILPVAWNQLDEELKVIEERIANRTDIFKV